MNTLAKDLSLVIDKTLRSLAEYDLRMNTPEVALLLLRTASVESDFRYLYQDNGPALSLFQIEPATATDIRDNFIAQRPELRAVLDTIARGSEWFYTLEDSLVENIPLSIAFARLKYWRVPAAIPSDFLAQASYWKQYYNSPSGRGKPSKFITSAVSNGVGD